MSHTHGQQLFAEALERSISGDGRRVERPRSSSLGAWFLGPKAENEDVLAKLVADAVAKHADDRRAFFPNDPIWISDEVKQSAAYEESVERLRWHHAELLRRLYGSVPFFSYRYQGHMLWDVTLPALAGYFAAMLYNQNNVAAEASPVTTLLEMDVGDDLCRMLGYTVPGDGGKVTCAVTPWGHITCDGTVANIEAMWASRNLKLYPIALAWALTHARELAPARELMIPLPDGGQGVLAELDTWRLLNLRADDVLDVPRRLADEYGIANAVLVRALRGITVQDIGFAEFSRRFFRPRDPSPIVVGPGTMHYSWPKAAALLGIGEQNLIRVPLDLDARLDVAALRTELDAAFAAGRPVMMVVVVAGTTEEGGVDPLADVIALRNEYRRAGLEFGVHVDAAWGGYFASLLRGGESSQETAATSQAELRHLREFTPEMAMSRYVVKQLEALPHADSITVDPHKAGYIPYPAGALCYRNSAMRHLVSFTAPVIDRGQPDANVGVFGVEGSKPGAAAAGVFLSHRVIPTDRSGYGKILGRSLFNSTRLYAALVTMADEEDPFTVVPLQRLPAERENAPQPEIDKQLRFIRKRIVPLTNDDLLADAEAMEFFRELGSDQLIVSYSFNFRTPSGINRDVSLLNKLNGKIFERLSLSPKRERVARTSLFLMSSALDPALCGRPLIASFRRRLGVEGDPEAAISFLISTTMDPWLTDTVDGNFVPTIIDALRQAVLESIAEVSPGSAAAR